MTQHSPRYLRNFVALHIESIYQALRAIFRQPISQCLILSMLAIAMMLPLSLFLITKNSQNVLAKLNEAPQITLYLNLDAAASDVAQFGEQLRQNKKQIKEVQFIGKEDGLATMQAAMNLGADFTALLDSNPLPDVYVVTPLSNQPEAVSQLQKELDGKTLVDSTQVNQEWLRTLWDFNQLMKKIFWFLMLMLCLTFLLQAYNTIRLQILSKKEEIEILKLLGAPSSFVRRPFIYYAFLQSLIAGIISVFLAQWAVKSIHPLVSKMLQPYGVEMAKITFPASEAFIFLSLVALMGIGGAWLATQQHLSRFRQQQ